MSKIKKIKILYLFRRPVKKTIDLATYNNFPHDYFFGFTKLDYRKFQKIVSDRIFESKLIFKILWATELVFIKAVHPFTKVGFSLISVIRHLGNIAKADVVFATADTYGLPLGFLQQFHLIQKPIVLYTGGLCDALVESKSLMYKQFCRLSLKNIAFIICGVEKECKKMSRILDLPFDKFKSVHYGIDTKYFSPSKENEVGKFILAIGADFKRDWGLYRKVAKKFPKIKFVIISMPNLIKVQMPKNVEIIHNLPIEKVREYIRKSMLLLILSKNNYRFAGHSTIFRGMSCAKTVIFTKSYGLENFNLQNFNNCIMVEPNNSSELIKAINYSLMNKKKLNEIGKNAREYILKYANYRTYTKQLEKIFLEAAKLNNQAHFFKKDYNRPRV